MVTCWLLEGQTLVHLHTRLDQLTWSSWSRIVFLTTTIKHRPDRSAGGTATEAGLPRASLGAIKAGWWLTALQMGSYSSSVYHWNSQINWKRGAPWEAATAGRPEGQGDDDDCCSSAIPADGSLSCKQQKPVIHNAQLVVAGYDMSQISQHFTAISSPIYTHPKLFCHQWPQLATTEATLGSPVLLTVTDFTGWQALQV